MDGNHDTGASQLPLTSSHALPTSSATAAVSSILQANDSSATRLALVLLGD